MATSVLKTAIPERLNLEKELEILQCNLIQQVRLRGIKLKTGLGDCSIDVSNWVVTFPYNYFYLCENPDIELIRKLALINLLYGYYLFAEDDFLDEKLTSPDEYRLLATRFCAMRPVRNLAIGFLLELCGSQVYQYVFDYEYAYYRAILSERQNGGNERFSLGSAVALTSLGMKGIPICIPFAALCQLTGCHQYIPDCESLVLHYHIAHQLFDDITDLGRDVQKADQSWLIRYIAGQLSRSRVELDDIRTYIRDSDLFYDVKSLIHNYLDRSEYLAGKLTFYHFIEQIRSFREALDRFSIINHVNHL